MKRTYIWVVKTAGEGIDHPTSNPKTQEVINLKYQHCITGVLTDYKKSKKVLDSFQTLKILKLQTEQKVYARPTSKTKLLTARLSIYMNDRLHRLCVYFVYK